MKGSTLFIILILLSTIILYIVYRDKKKVTNKGDEEKVNDSINIPPAPPPPSLDINVSQTDLIYDPYSGPGRKAVSDYASEIFRSNTDNEIRRTLGIGGKLFPPGITQQRDAVINHIRNNAIETAGVQDDYGLDLIPSFVDTSFVNQLTELVNFTNDGESTLRANGNDILKVSKRLVELSDFSGNSNFSLFKKHVASKEDLGSSPTQQAYGRCRGTKKSKENCVKGNWEKLLGSEIQLVAQKLLVETKKFEKELFNYSVQSLKNSGWKFVGI